MVMVWGITLVYLLFGINYRELPYPYEMPFFVFVPCSLACTLFSRPFAHFKPKQGLHSSSFDAKSIYMHNIFHAHAVKAIAFFPGSEY